MSTGDQTQYIRSKMAERGTTREASFMRDGFDNWAESETPARVGQMEKMPAEPQMENFGGAMTVRSARHRLRTMEHEMSGGLIPIPDAVKKAINEAKKLIQMWRDVSKWLDELKDEIKYEVLQNPTIPNSYKNVAQKIVTYMDMLAGLKGILDFIAANSHYVGLGKHGNKMRGGASASEIITEVGKFVAKIAEVYGWFRDNAGGIKAVLSMRALNSPHPVGNEILKAITPIFSAIGLGKHKKCCCGSAAPKKMLQIADSYHEDAAQDMQQAMGGRRRSASINVRPMRNAPSDEHVSIMPVMGGKRKVGGKMFQAERGPTKSVGSVARAAHAVGGRAPSARGAIVRKVMAEHGLSLPQASKYVKEHGLY